MSDPKKEYDDTVTKPWALPEFNVQSHRCHISKKMLTVASARSLNNQKEENKSGFAQGYEAGLAQAKSEVNKQLSVLSQLISQLSTENHHALIHIKQESFSFIQLATERILGEILSEQPEKIKTLAQKAIETLDNRTVSIKIVCDDNLFDILNSHADIFQGKSAIIEKESSLQPFSFRIESTNQLLEFDIHESIEKLIDDYKCLTIK